MLEQLLHYATETKGSMDKSVQQQVHVQIYTYALCKVGTNQTVLSYSIFPRNNYHIAD